MANAYCKMAAPSSTQGTLNSFCAVGILLEEALKHWKQGKNVNAWKSEKEVFFLNSLFCV